MPQHTYLPADHIQNPFKSPPSHQSRTENQKTLKNLHSLNFVWFFLYLLVGLSVKGKWTFSSNSAKRTENQKQNSLNSNNKYIRVLTDQRHHTDLKSKIKYFFLNVCSRTSLIIAGSEVVSVRQWSQLQSTTKLSLE